MNSWYGHWKHNPVFRYVHLRMKRSSSIISGQTKILNSMLVFLLVPPRRFSTYFQVFDYYSLYKVLLRRFAVFTPTGLNLRVPNTVEINVTAVHVSVYSQDLLICGITRIYAMYFKDLYYLFMHCARIAIFKKCNLFSFTHKTSPILRFEIKLFKISPEKTD